MAPTTDRPSAGDIPLPPAKMRWGGKSYKDDDSYRASAERSAALLATACGLSADSRVLDIGCGQGRLLLGILRKSVGQVPCIGAHRQCPPGLGLADIGA